MKVTTKILSGYGIFIALLAGLAVFQTATIRRMQSINRELSENNFQFAQICLQALRVRDLVDEYALKSSALADPEYLSRLQGYQEDFESSLNQLKDAAKTEEGRAGVERVVRTWDSLKPELLMLQKGLPQGQTAMPQGLQDNLEELGSQTFSLYQSALRSMSENAAASRKAAETTALVLWCAAFAAPAIGILASFLIYHSVSKPLARLAEGTREIAEGKLLYRLDTSRNDELSQIARDFNRIALRLNELNRRKDGLVPHLSDELNYEAGEPDAKSRAVKK